MAEKDDRYLLDEDGLLVEKVGPWAKQKLKLVTDYIQASGGARRDFLRTDAAYIDVFSGPGRSKIRDNGQFIDGSPVAAFKKGKASLAPFTSIHISDARTDLLASCKARLEVLGAPVYPEKGPASDAMPAIVRQLDPSGLHFAFLDPHNLGALSFDLFQTLSKLKRIDIIVHVSVSDLQRNVDRYTSELHTQFDKFAPGWRAHISAEMNQERLRAKMLEYWSDKVMALGLPRAKHCELITGSRNQRLYWLIFLAKASFAHSLWKKISSAAKAPELFG